jgi:hypothetical protein
MKVDRSGFLLAVSAIAAACAAQEPRTITVVAMPVQPTASPGATDEPAPPAPSAVAPTYEGYGLGSHPAREGFTPPSREGFTPAQEGVAPAQEGNDDAMCRAKKVTRLTKCDDDRGNPGECSKAPCRSTAFICSQCEDYKRYFKPKIAERAVACVVTQTPAQANDGCRTYQCGDEALKSACIDTTADSACTAIAKACKTTMGECRGMLSGMNAAGRARITACAQKGCPYGLWSCVEGM